MDKKNSKKQRSGEKFLFRETTYPHLIHYLLAGCGQHDGRSLRGHVERRGAGGEGAGEGRGRGGNPGGPGA